MGIRIIEFDWERKPGFVQIMRRFENTRLKNSGPDSILLYKINHVFWEVSK